MVTLLFVYLGHTPDYVFENIARTRALFPSKKIVFCGTQIPPLDWINKHKIDFIRQVPDPEFDTYAKQFGDINHGQNGYWRFTVERLLAISTYHEQFSNEKILHVESDVILMPNFPIETFATLEEAAWIGYGNKADIASIVYLPNFESTKLFRKMILAELSLGNLNDMKILFNVRNRIKVTLLPVAESNDTIFGGVKSKYYQGDIASLEDQDVFEGIFDSASIGIWLTGQDPRNRFGFTKIRTMEIVNNGAVQVDPSQGSFSLDSKGLLFILNSRSERIPVYNLHIHSKDIELFSRNWESRLRRYIEIDGNHPRFVEFNFRMFLELLRLNTRQKTLVRFLLNTPLMVRLRKLRLATKNPKMSDEEIG